MRDKSLSNENLQAPERAALRNRAGIADYAPAVGMNVLYHEFVADWTAQAEAQRPPVAQIYSSTVTSPETAADNMTPPTESFNSTAAMGTKERRIIAAQQATKEAFNEPAA